MNRNRLDVGLIAGAIILLLVILIFVLIADSRPGFFGSFP